ncbi:hypothetical protein, partial [Aerococcus mictus]|uniref:hypothetical protein n=1 Tax=Aerococcus mictus TaxID=2976810 RepID=UPI001C660A27
ADCGAKFLDASEFIDLDTSCYADPMHLNRGGMQALSELIVKWRNGSLSGPQIAIRCIRYPDRGGEIGMEQAEIPGN